MTESKLSILKADLKDWKVPDFTLKAKDALTFNLNMDVQLSASKKMGDVQITETSVFLGLFNFYENLTSQLNDTWSVIVKGVESPLKALQALEAEAESLCKKQPLLHNPYNSEPESFLYWLYFRFSQLITSWGGTGRILSETIRCDIASSISWSIPTQAMLKYMVKESKGKLTDLGAGTGYWAAHLELAGAKVTAMDDMSDTTGSNKKRVQPRFHDIVNMDLS